MEMKHWVKVGQRFSEECGGSNFLVFPRFSTISFFPEISGISISTVIHNRKTMKQNGMNLPLNFCFSFCNLQHPFGIFMYRTERNYEMLELGDGA